MPWPQKALDVLHKKKKRGNNRTGFLTCTFNLLLTSDRERQLVGLFGGELQFQHAQRSASCLNEQCTTPRVDFLAGPAPPSFLT